MQSAAVQTPDGFDSNTNRVDVVRIDQPFRFDQAVIANRMARNTFRSNHDDQVRENNNQPL